MTTDPAEELGRFLEQQIELYGDELALPKEALVGRSGEAAAAGAAAEGADRRPDPVTRIREAVESPPPRTVEPLPDLDLSTLAELQERISGCQRCAIGGRRRNLVFGEGNPSADIVLIGEAPGFHEDQQGVPFIGEAGQLLTRILASIELKRSEVYICNLLKCRPDNNRDPLPDEVANCLPYLEKQLELIHPAFILCLGRFSAQTMLQSQAPLTQLRGKVHQWKGSRLIVTYHPAALLRYPKFKRETWQDVQLLRRLYDEFLAENHPR